MGKVYDAAYKLEVCRRLTDGESVAVLSQELGISDNTLYGWKKQYGESGEGSFPGSGHLKPEDAEIRRLQKENRDLREENEILKKAAAYFAKNQK